MSREEPVTVRARLKFYVSCFFTSYNESSVLFYFLWWERKTIFLQNNSFLKKQTEQQQSKRFFYPVGMPETLNPFIWPYKTSFRLILKEVYTFFIRLS